MNAQSGTRGTSYHYQQPEKTAVTSDDAVAAVATVLRDAGVEHTSGVTWSTDAFFRETRSEVVRHIGEGVTAIDMQASTLYTAAAERGVDLVPVFAPSNYLTLSGWVSPNDEGVDTLERSPPP